MGYYIRTKNSDNKYISHKVPKEIYYYILQLEAYIRHPEISKLKEFYSERFLKGG